MSKTYFVKITNIEGETSYMRVRTINEEKAIKIARAMYCNLRYCEDSFIESSYID